MEKPIVEKPIVSDKDKQKPDKNTSHNLREISKDPKSVESIAKNARKNIESNSEKDNEFLSKQLEDEQFFDQAKYGEKQCHNAKHYLGLLASTYRKLDDRTLDRGRDLLWTLVKKEADQNLALQDTLERLSNSSKNNISDQQAIIEPTQEKDQPSSDHIISNPEHLKALVNETVKSRQQAKSFNSREFLESIGIEERKRVIIKDSDHNTWKKYLDDLIIDSDVRHRTQMALIRREEKYINLERKEANNKRRKTNDN